MQRQPTIVMGMTDNTIYHFGLPGLAITRHSYWHTPDGEGKRRCIHLGRRIEFRQNCPTGWSCRHECDIPHTERQAAIISYNETVFGYLNGTREQTTGRLPLQQVEVRPGVECRTCPLYDCDESPQ